MSFFDFESAGRLDPKIHVHSGSLPAFIDPKQPPNKKGPWRTFNDAPFLQTVNLLLPEELYTLIWDRIELEMKSVRYSKVIMKLQNVLEGNFFTEYIKKGASYNFALFLSPHLLASINEFNPLSRLAASFRI